MVVKINSIENNTWEQTSLPKEVNLINVKWAYKSKLNENGKAEKYKAQSVAKGYAQKYGIEYTYVFAPVARLDIVRVILGMEEQGGWEVV